MLRLSKGKRHFCLTVDVEPDADKSWKTSNPITFDGVHKGVAMIQVLCQEYGVKATYFLNPIILKNEECISFFRKLGSSKCEVGTHLHGEYKEPQAQYQGNDFSGCDPSEMQCEYPKDLEFRKLKNLTDLFVSKFGYRPRSFRAGRFGARGWTMHCLQELGYSHDSSVTPFRNWYNKADFSQAKHLCPYYASQEDILKRTNAGIIEVPITITPDKLWLRPTPGFSNLSRMKKIVKWYEKKYKNVTVCCTFHNIELVPGKSPYCLTKRDCEKMLITLTKFFRFLKKRGHSFLTIKEVTV